MSGEGRQAWIWFRPICWRPDLGLWGWVLLGVAGTSLLSSWGPSRGSWNFLPFFLEGGGVSLGLCSSGLEGPFAVPSSAMVLGLVVTCTSGVAGEAVCWVGRGPLGFDRSSGSSLLGWRTGGAGNSTRDGEFFPPSTRGVSPFLATDSSRGCLLRPSAPRWDIRRSWRLRGVMGSWRGNPHSARGVRPVGVR